MTYRAKAPLRLGFGGGGTDVPPYSERYNGYILNATINKYVYVTLELNNSGKIAIHSLDFVQTQIYDAHEKLPYDENLDLIKATINRLTDRFPQINIDGCNVYIRSDAPPGAGLGTSSTVVVALIGAFIEAFNLKMNLYEISHLAWIIERKDMGFAGGKQDQYTAAFGGVNFMEFHTTGEVYVNTLRLTKDVINELQSNLLLLYTGLLHTSHDVIKAQSELTKKRIVHLEHLKQIAVAMKEDLLVGDLSNFGNLLSSDWRHKKNLSSKISNARIDELTDLAIGHSGVHGLKITGAGGGGVLIIYCDWKSKQDIANIMHQKGCTILDCTITKTGLETWSVKR